MKISIDADGWTGQLEDLSITSEAQPYIVSCLVTPAGGTRTRMYFSINDGSEPPFLVNHVITNWIIPRLANKPPNIVRMKNSRN